MPERMPVFVKLEDYQELTSLLNQTVDKLKKARALLEEIKQLKSQEDEELENWEKDLGETEEKIEKIDEILTEPEQT